VASVANLNWPSSASLSPVIQQRELISILNRMQESRLNAIFFQVRPEGDALYRSELEPWSRFLGGTQGVNPGWDPLEFLVTQAHRRNIEVHAWLNPYRAQAVPPPASPPVYPHLANQHPELVHPYGQLLWMDPAAPLVRQRLRSVCLDIVQRYDVDGVHFDDYFYPYPEAELDFPDQLEWEAYTASGGSLNKGDWRREQVNGAIEEISLALHREKPHVRFGISPFGIPAPHKPESISGLNQYEKLYADTQLWMDRGWIDYLAPQLYWPTIREAQAYAVLLEWWVHRVRPGHSIFAGINLAALGTKPEWSLDEYRKQFDVNNRTGAHGYILWSIAPLLEERQSVAREIFATLNAQSALTPPLARSTARSVALPQIDQESDRFRLHHQDSTPLRAWTVYRQDDGRWTLDHIVPGEECLLRLKAGRWAVAAACKDGQESLGQIVEVPLPTDP
jgi:uncharacterized lipoprotein YddW (UPF0748 family)